jgi:hypothetical protein
MDYRIDYDHIDVADIMAQVKKRAAERPPAPEPPAAAQSCPPGAPEAPAVPPSSPEPPIMAPTVPPPASGWKRLVKRTVRFLFRPYLRFLIPLDEWYRFRTTLEANARIDGTINRIAKAREEFSVGLTSVREDISATRQELGETRHGIVTRMDANWEFTRERIGTTRETVKLLHNLAHNLVVELTKLKVEEEALKSKARILEKELEMLGTREKAIEKKVFE